MNEHDAIKKLNEVMNHPLHPHPELEEQLGVDHRHVIVNIEAWKDAVILKPPVLISILHTMN
jgi:hypothetical protein